MASLLAVPTAVLLSRTIFGSSQTNPTWIEYLLGYGYSVGLWCGILTLGRLCVRPEIRPAKIPAGNGGSQYRAIAMLLSAAVATLAVVSCEDFLNGQRACWVKLTVRTASPDPPELSIRYGASPQEREGFQWQPYGQTVVTLRRAEASVRIPGIHIERLRAGGSPVELSGIRIDGGIQQDGTVTISAPRAMLRWPGGSTTVSFLVSGEPEPVEFYWLDQLRRVRVGPRPQEVSFDLGGTYQGWALLPPQQIGTLLLDSAAGMAGITAIRGELLEGSHPVIDFSESQLSSTREVEWPLPSPINRRQPAVLAMAWTAVFALGLLAAFLLFRLSAAVENWRGVAALRTVCCPPMPRPSQQWGGFLRVALPVWIVCVTYHALFALSVRTAFTNDSVDYYGMGRAFSAAPYLRDILITRTPGYPLLIAAVLRLFGDTVLGIAILQHLALASLSVIAIWCLWDRLPRPWPAVAGLLAGITPALTPTANIVWTEAGFSFLGCTALLLASCYRRRPAYMLAAGVCAGLATMFRPNGLLLPAAVAGGLILEFLWLRSGGAWRVYGRAVLLLVSGYALAALPWHMHLAVDRHTFALGKGLREFSSWAGYVFESRLPVDLPVNRPNRAIFADPAAYGNEPYVLIANFPVIRDPGEIYYRETQAEWLESQDLAPYLAGFLYNATLVQHRSTLPYVFAEIRDTLGFWCRPVPVVRPANGDIRQMLTAMTSTPPLAPPQTGLLLMGLGAFVLANWKWLAAAVLLGVAVSVVMPWMIPLLAYAVATVVAYSTNLVPSERYIVVLEPVYYIVAAAAAYGLMVATRQRRKAQRPVHKLLPDEMPLATATEGQRVYR